jgi:manganese-dependent inorganic pyrophosphatase
MIYVIGHKNPDTDAIVSALIYSDFLNQTGHSTTPVKLGKLNKETEFVLKYWKAPTPETKTNLDPESQISLVDHNERSQSIDNLDQYKLVSIIDHHKFNLVTAAPLEIIAKPVGSTATVLAEMFFMAGIEPSQQQAGLLISAIMSDTLHYRSSTTTDTDKLIVEKLNQIAQIDNLEDYSLQMFNAKSDLGDIQVEDLIRLDYKEYEIANSKVAVGVLETTSTDYGLKRKQEIITKLKEIKKQDQIDHLLFSIVNIIEETNIGLVADTEDQEFFKNVFQTNADNHQVDLGDKLSRKKQLIPNIEIYLNQSKNLT